MTLQGQFILVPFDRHTPLNVDLYDLTPILG
jgi:hypothetical protein